MVPAPDLLQRDVTADRSDLRWDADISPISIAVAAGSSSPGSGIRDLKDHSPVGWSTGEHQTTDLVVAALVMALGRRNPTDELLHLADHGTQGAFNQHGNDSTAMDEGHRPPHEHTRGSGRERILRSGLVAPSLLTGTISGIPPDPRIERRARPAT